MKRQTIGILSAIRNMGVRVVALSLLLLASRAAAMAQCGDSLKAMATAAPVGRTQTPFEAMSQSSVQSQSASDGDFGNTSIVGLWHIRFIVGGKTIQEAFQIWNDGGTEVHNPNVDPRTGNVCLGAWKEADRSFRLTHRVWLYDANGNFQGTGHLSETLVLDGRGDTHTGSFTLGFYDPAGNFQGEVSGSVVGERISPD